MLQNFEKQKNQLQYRKNINMQLKLKQNPQTASVFQKKQLKPKPLNHIVELTQQNQTTRYNKDQINIQKIKLIKKQSQNSQDNLAFSWKQYFSCFKNICQTWTGTKTISKQMDVNQTQFTQLIEKIKSKKTTFNVVLPPQKQPKKTLVLDLDQTLVHTTFNKPDKYDFQTEINFNGKTTKVYTVKRFGLDAFLFEMSQIYEIVVFTASQKQYADKIIAEIDPKKRISHLLNRDHCIIINKVYYLKNLKILGRDLKQIILVDDNKMAGILQPQNFYKIDQFLGNSKDRKLVQLSSFLKHVNDSKYMLPIHASRKRFEDIEIKIKEQNSNKSRSLEQSYRKSIQQKKRHYRHKKTNSEVQSLFTNNTQNTQGDQQKQKDVTTQSSQTNEDETTGYDLIRKQC